MNELAEVTNIVQFDPSLDDEKKITEVLARPVVPKGKHFKSRQLIKACDANGVIDPWKYFFFYKARLFTLYKKTQARSATWYFRASFDRREMNRSTQRSLLNEARDEAIERWLNKKPEAAMEDTNYVLGRLRLKPFFDAWERINEKVQNGVCRNNLSAARRILAVIKPGVSENSLMWDDLFYPGVGRDYAVAKVEAAVLEAERRYGPGSQRVKMVKAKTTSAAAVTVKRLKSFFADKYGSLIDQYAKLGVTLDDAKVRRFREQKIMGKRDGLAAYIRPDDRVIKRTFEEIEKFNVDEPIHFNSLDHKIIYNPSLSPAEIEKMLWQRPATEMAEICGMSDHHFGKMCKQIGIIRPGGRHNARFWKEVAAGNRPNPNGVIPKECKPVGRPPLPKSTDIDDRSIRKYHVYILFWLCVGFGLRCKEAASTPRENIRFVDGRMTLVGIGKNEEKLIDIDAQPDAADAILPWLDKDEEYLIGATWSRRYNTVPRILRRQMREWGWKTDNLLHELRAYIGYRIFSEIGPIEAQQFMRHQNVKTTEDYYAGKWMTRRAAAIKLR
jgi:hypothetical protein